MDSSLRPFFAPRGVVVVGASTSPEKLGYGVARNLVQSGYAGAIHFVSQRAGQLFGRPIYTSLSEVPEPVDLAILIVPPSVTPESIRACAERGIHAAIIVSAGFREAGAQGAALEAECVRIARENRVRLLGPNCIGTIDTHLPLDTTFLQPPMPAAGGIGFLSHSGAFCAAIIDWARQQGFGFSQLVSLGNQADVTETDMLPLLAADEHTRVIVLYMESVSAGRRFIEVARQVAREKPVIALKAGRFAAGQKAAASHTGALAASDTAFSAAFEKAGVLRAETAEQMFDWARILETSPLPRGRNIAILTNAGGPGVIAADALETNGLQLAPLSESTLQALAAHLPPAASVRNPVDMLASASPADYAFCLHTLLSDSNVDAALVILPPPPMFKAEDAAAELVAVIRQFDKPVAIALMGSTLVTEAYKVFQQAAVPTYPFPERAASALGALAQRAGQIRRLQEPLWQPEKIASSPTPLSGEELLQAYQIPTAPLRLARGAQEAATLARELGFPLVMKIASADILHKSDVGGVLLNLGDEQAVISGYTQLIEHVRTVRPQARLEGVYLQRQIPTGQEVIVGMTRDAHFGPLMMFGSGGVEVEGLKDVAFALAPLNPAEAEEMIRKTWAGRKLRGFRNIPTGDEASVVDILIKLSHLVLEHPEIREIEINPLRVLPQGAIAVDVRMRLAK
ncbi:MAG: acetate--CoA ligase family protein [Anaerolineae bacterium]